MCLYLESKYFTIRPTKFDNDTIINDIYRYYQILGYDQYQAVTLTERYNQLLEASEASIQEFNIGAFDLNGREKFALDCAQLRNPRMSARPITNFTTIVDRRLR
ncbi:hypothetical protein BJV82DRAFT_577660 [Fennellomyces sp. T-0311]|nr:hypothetical protein BJV82DRAFT_577660 [Fennellomyces sp. T-0311]